MPASTALDIPFERQSDLTANRLCGPAALCMVYRSLGVSCTQAEVAAKVAPGGVSANVGTRTYVLARDALERGLSAIVLRAKDPLRTLQACHQPLLRVILNHRPRMESSNGHFTVLVGVAPEFVVVHDPLLGPNTRILKGDLLQLMQPLGGPSEISGNVLVVLAKDPPAVGPCPTCGSIVPETIACPGCRKLVALRPAAALGCSETTCPERQWETVFCPYCDTVLLAASDKGSASPPPSQPEGSEEAAMVQNFVQQIDKFFALLLAANNGQPAPGTEIYYTQIRDLQNQLLAYPKPTAIVPEPEATKPAAAPPPQPAPSPEPVAARPPRPPVDWNVLGQTLCAELLGNGVATTQFSSTPDGSVAASEHQPTAKEIVEDMRKRGMLH